MAATIQKEYTHKSSSIIRAASHAPVQDIIAIATEDNKLTVHRLVTECPFQKLFV